VEPFNLHGPVEHGGDAIFHSGGVLAAALGALVRTAAMRVITASK